MRTLLLSLLAAVGLGYLGAPTSLQEKGGDDRTGRYDVVPNWPQPLAFAKPGYKQGMNWGRDILSVDGGTLTLVRDLESGGGSTTRTLTYSKAL